MNNSSVHNASGSMAGYQFQSRLALLRGLQMARSKPNGHISIEKYDDIAFENDDFAACLIQAKHSVNPSSIADTSVDLWKTLKIWIDDLTQTITTFSSTKYALITTSEAVENSACAKLRSGATDEDRKCALELLRNAAKNSTNKTTSQSRKTFLALSDDEAFTLLRQIEIFDRHPNLIDVMADIEAELILIAPGNQTSAASYLEGWWLSVVGRCLIEERSAAIPVQHIIMKANEIGRMFAEDALPVDDPLSLGAREYSDDDESELFVRQMRVVGTGDRIVERGARDYYRAAAQRSKWARENLLLDTELRDYDAKLEDRWARKFDTEIDKAQPSSEEEKRNVGRELCRWASLESVPLRSVVEAWITSGTFQGLSDQLRVGWHPDFEIIFGEDNEHDDA